MNKVWVRQATQHFYPRTSDEGKNPWHWQLWEPTYRLALLFHHNWDGWWIGSCFDGVKGKASRVWSPRKTRRLSNLLLSNPVSLCMVHLGREAAKSLPVFPSLVLRKTGAGRKDLTCPWSPVVAWDSPQASFPSESAHAPGLLHFLQSRRISRTTLCRHTHAASPLYWRLFSSPPPPDQPFSFALWLFLC